LALVVAGCSSSSASAPSKASYDKQANAICQTFNSKLKSVGSAISSSSSGTQVASALTDAISVAEQGSAKLEALPKPSGDNTALNKAYAAQDAQVTQMKQLVAAIKQNDAAKAQSTEAALNASNDPLNAQFDALGLTTCGSGSST
jgi:hypothetical protein